MTQVNELRDVPEEKVDGKVAEYEALGYRVEKVRQSDGRWTIIARQGSGRDRE